MTARAEESWLVPRRTACLLGAGFFFVALGWSRRVVASGSVDLSVIVHPSNSAAFTEDDIADIFRTVMRSWPGGRPIAAFELPPKSAEREFFDRTVLKMEPDDVARFWIDRRMRGGAPPPHEVPDPSILVRVVAKLENAIGYAPTGLLNASVRSVARVRDGRVALT